jgi:hypothetical protein
MKSVATIALAAMLGTAVVAGSAEPVEAKHNNKAAAIGLGVFALTLGAIAASRHHYGPHYGYYHYPYPGPYYGPSYHYDSRGAWCDRRYKSYNPRTRHYLGYDGRGHYC